NLKTEIAEIKKTASAALGRPLRRDEYLQQIDGLALGSGTRGSYLSKGRYVCARESLSVDVPAGWTASPGSGERVLTMARPAADCRAELRVQLKLTPGGSADVARQSLR